MSSEHRQELEVAIERAADPSRDIDGRFTVDLSSQAPSTDTLALAVDDNAPLRHDDGRLVMRPGGHGALLDNLSRSGGDLVFVKNVDNVLPATKQAVVVHWQEVLGGLLVEMTGRIHGLLRRLEDAVDVTAPDDGTLLLEELLDSEAARIASRPWPERRRALVERLDRPIRVCGVVPNTGEPGGGPFWVEHPDGVVSRQIVERAEVDANDDAQRAVFRSAGHFNPVQLACAVLDHRGQPHDLGRYVDRKAVFISRKSHQGRSVRALEHPGLWNGAMSGWTTLFVEVPIETFAPVKTIFDLLRPSHQVE